MNIKSYVGNQLSHTILLLSLFLSAILFHAKVSADETTEPHGNFEGAMETVYPDWFKLSFMELEEDVAEAAEEGKRLMLLFHQDGCPYCNAFVERNLAQKDIEQTLKTQFDVIEFNMWGDREVVSVGGEIYTEKLFAEALGVQFTPTILFLTEQGGLSLRLNGYYDPDRFRVALRYVNNKLENTISFADYVSEQETISSNKTLVNRDYFTAPIDQLANRPDNNKKPLLLFFEQGSCSNCETLHDTILSKPESQSLLSQFDVFQVDMWGNTPFTTPDGEQTTGRKWSKTLGVAYAPTLILFSADGTEVIRSEAYFKSFHTQSILDYVASDAWRDQPSFQRYLSARADHIIEQGKDVNIWGNDQ